MDSEKPQTTTSNERECFEKIQSKVQILDAEFHPSESIIALGLINGKLKLYFSFHSILVKSL